MCKYWNLYYVKLLSHTNHFNTLKQCWNTSGNPDGILSICLPKFHLSFIIRFNLGPFISPQRASLPETWFSVNHRNFLLLTQKEKKRKKWMKHYPSSLVMAAPLNYWMPHLPFYFGTIWAKSQKINLPLQWGKTDMLYI